jgi:hypothetical protein
MSAGSVQPGVPQMSAAALGQPSGSAITEKVLRRRARAAHLAQIMLIIPGPVAHQLAL